MRNNAKFREGDRVVFLGSKHSCYGRRSASDKFKGQMVTITAVHENANPPAYLMDAENVVFWYEEKCFEHVAPQELPGFESYKVDGLLELFR